MIEAARLEGVGEAEQQEAWFRHLTRDTQADVYMLHYMQWLKQPMRAHTAYIQRACMGLQAKCYLQVWFAVLPCIDCCHSNEWPFSLACDLQARWDAQQAVTLLASQLKVSEVGINRASNVEHDLGEAYWRLGQAFTAERDHPDQDHRQAAKVCSATKLLF